MAAKPSGPKPERMQLQVSGQSTPLACLYNARKAEFLPDKSLWKDECIQNNTRTTTDPASASMTVSAQDDFYDKKRNLSAGVELCVNLYGGMIKVKGEGAYLKNSRSTTRSEAMSLCYKRCSHEKYLVNMMRGSIDPKMIRPEDVGGATHVVVAVRYGNTAALTFEKTVTTQEEREEVRGRLDIYARMSAAELKGMATVDMKNADVGEHNGFRVTYHGDIELKTNPITLAEAIQVYKELPKELTKEKAVPQMVTLAPIDEFRDPIEQVVVALEDNALKKLLNMLVYLDSTAAGLQGLKDVAESYPAVSRQFSKTITPVQREFDRYQTEFMQKLANMMPAIRGGTRPVTDLMTLVQEVQYSPFSEEYMSQWIEQMEFVSQSLHKIFKASGLMKKNSRNITNRRAQLKLLLILGSDPVPDDQGQIQGGGDEVKEDAGLNIVTTVKIPVYKTDLLLEAARDFNKSCGLPKPNFEPTQWHQKNHVMVSRLESYLSAEYEVADDAGLNVKKVPVWKAEHMISTNHCFVMVEDITADPNLPIPSVKSIGVNLDLYKHFKKLGSRPTTFMQGPPGLTEITESGHVATFKNLPDLDHTVSVICGPTISSGKHIFKMRIEQCPLDSELWLGFVSAEGRFDVEIPHTSIGNTGKGANAFIKAGYGMRCGFGSRLEEGAKQRRESSPDGMCCGEDGKKSGRNSKFGIMPEGSVIEGQINLDTGTISYRTPNTRGKFVPAFANIRKGTYRPCVSGHAKGPGDDNGNKNSVIVRVVN